MGFILDKPVSFDPSVAIENGPFFIRVTSADLKKGAKDPLTIHVVLVLADA